MQILTSLRRWNYVSGIGCMKLGLVVLMALVTPVLRAQMDFAGAEVLTGDWGSVTNDNTGAIRDPGAPSTAGLPANAPLWYSWTAPHDGVVELDTVGSTGVETNLSFVSYNPTNFTVIYVTNVANVNLDTVLGVYTGTSVSRLAQVAANDDLFPVSLNLPQLTESGSADYLSLSAFNRFFGLGYGFFGGSIYSYTQPYYGPSHLKFNASGGVTYYFAADTKTTSVTGPIKLSWAYESSGVFRFASEDFDPSTGLPLYQTAQTESQFQNGLNNQANSVILTYYTYNARGVLVTVTREAGSTGRVMVDYATVSGTNFSQDVPTNDVAAIPYQDFTPVSGTLIFDDYEMSKTILIPIRYTGLTAFDQTNRVFGVQLSNPRPDPLESSEISAPRLDPSFSTAMVRILNMNADPYGPDMVPMSVTNLVGGTNVVSTTNVMAQFPTNAIFNFQKANFRVPADVNSTNSPWTKVTLYVERFGTNDAGVTLHYRVNNILGNDQDASEEQNIYFPLQPGSDYAVPTPPNSLPIRGTNSDFDLAQGTITFPSGGSAAATFQPIDFTIPTSSLTKFNKDFRVQIYQEVSINNQTVPRLVGEVNEATVTILTDDQHPPAGSVDELYNADFNHGLALPPALVPITAPQNNPNPGAAGQVYGLAVLPNNETVIVGDFPSYDGFGRNRIALVNTDGSLDTSFDPGSGANDFINCVAVTAPGQYVIGGGFSSFNGVARNRIARINANGSLDASFNTSVGADGTVWTVALQSDGKVIVGGDFTHINGSPCQYIARLTTNGVVDTTFSCTNISGSVYSLALQGNQVVVGGNFSVTGQIYNDIARLNTDGSLDTTFNPGTGADGSVFALASQPNGQIILGGGFSHMNGSAFNSLVRLNNDGSIDTTNFFVGTGADDTVYSISLQPDGTMYIGGAFSTFNGTHRLGFARLYANGTLDTTFLDTAYNQFAGLKRIYSYDSPAVYTSAVQSDGGVLIGGSFYQVGGGQADTNVCASLDDELGYTESFGDPNLWVEPKTRDGVRNRSNFARLIGGATPGPGNVSMFQNSYSANKSQSALSVSLIRTNGTLGPIGANFSVIPSLAQSGADYIYNATPPLFWTASQFTTHPSRMRSEGLYGQNGALEDIYGLFLGLSDVAINNLSGVTVSIRNNKLNAGNLSAQFQLANPSDADTFFLGGLNIPLGSALGVSQAPFTLIDDNKQAGTFGFTAPTLAATNLTTTINVVRSNGVYGNVSMRYATGGGTAVAGVDYNAFNNKTLTFLPGVLSQSFTFSIINNGNIYTNPVEKNVNLVLSSLAGPVGGNAAFGITNTVFRIINPNYQGYVTFGATNYSGTESSGFIQFVVNRSSGSKGSLTVQYATTDGTAVNGVDYHGITNTLQWADGDVSPRIINLPLINNEAVGGNKQLAVSLFNPTLNGVSTPGLLGLIPNCTLTIINDNSYGSLQLSQSNYIVNEDGGYATITATRTGGAAGNVSVNYATANGSAVSGTNYVNSSGILTFVPGQISASFNVPILNDGVQDPASFYFNVALSNPTNAVLGSPVSAAVQIVDAQSYNRPPGSPDTAFNPNTSMNGDIFALAQQSNGQIIAGGGFTTVGTTPESHLARLNVDGSLDTTFLNGLSGVNGSVLTVADQTDDRLLIGGAFTFVDGISSGYLARLMTDGSLDTSFNVGSGADNSVYAIAETFVGGVRKIYAGGAFGSVSSVTSPAIIRLNNDGTVDTSFATGTGANAPVYAIAVYPTNSIYAGKVLIGGAFTQYNGTNLNHIARLNADGTVDASFNAGSGANDVVRTIKIQNDGRVLLGGSFTSLNGVSLNRIARLNADGSVDESFANTLGIGVDGSVNSIALQPDNRIILAGAFSQNNGMSRNGITRLLPTGAVDTSINFGTGANASINAALVQPADGMIVIGGAFTQFNGQTHDRIARIYGGSATVGSVVIPAGSALVQEGYSPANGIIDPGETVGVMFAFRASVGLNVNDLMATLIATNGITLPSPVSQSYGPLTVSGPSASRLFTFQADPAYTNGQQITATFQLNDGTNNLGTARFTYGLGVATNVFANTNVIVINDYSSASPYPSAINVGGLVGTVVRATVTFTNLTHTWPADIDALLESPVQQGTLLMANAGSGSALHGATLNFDDGAAMYLPQTNQIVSGTYKPTAYFPVATFPVPAPAAPYATNMAAFNGSVANGVWSLFVIDDTHLYYGAISNGWSLKLVTANPVVGAADVALGMSASPATASISNNLSFILVVTNYGPASANGVSVTDTLPAGVSFVSATATQGSAVQNGSTVAWSIGSLAANAGARLTITVKPTLYGVINNSAHVISTSMDPNPDDDTASVSVDVSSVSAPVLSGSVSAGNGQFQFTLAGTAGASYIVQASTNLLNWVPIMTNTIPNTGSMSFTDSAAVSYPTRFYRALIGP